MKKTGTCPKCSSKKVLDSDKPYPKTVVHRWVCMECGFVEWYAGEEYLQIVQKMIDKGKV
ncbi:MAG: hypothetical protein FWC29_06195 [Methanomassiliicoccaceae archaeon]|nr:hypothetical protein [Methanomassiliicoccaceae archaeon]